MDVEQELAAMPARLAALLRNEADTSIDETVREWIEEDGAYLGLPAAERARQIYRHRIQALTHELENMLDEQDGSAQAWREEQARRDALSDEERCAEHAAWLTNLRGGLRGDTHAQ